MPFFLEWSQAACQLFCRTFPLCKLRGNIPYPWKGNDSPRSIGHNEEEKRCLAKQSQPWFLGQDKQFQAWFWKCNWKRLWRYSFQEFDEGGLTWNEPEIEPVKIWTISSKFLNELNGVINCQSLWKEKYLFINFWRIFLQTF